MAAYLHGVRLGLLLAGAGRSPAGSTRPSPTFLSRDGSVGKKPSTRSPDRLLRGWYGGPGSHHQDRRSRVGGEISGCRAEKQVVQRAVPVAPDHHQVGASVLGDFHDLFAWAAYANHELPGNAGSANGPEDVPPDL